MNMKCTKTTIINTDGVDGNPIDEEVIPEFCCTDGIVAACPVITPTSPVITTSVSYNWNNDICTSTTTFTVDSVVQADQEVKTLTAADCCS